MAEKENVESTREEQHQEDPGFSAGPTLSLETIMAAACDVKHQVEDGLMALVPPEVTEHLVNSQKEMIRAGQRLAEMGIECLDEKIQRAQRIHETMRAEKGADKSGA